MPRPNIWTIFASKQPTKEANMATWQHTTIDVNGVPVKTQAPVIISASRSTDIPAFYADWFFHRLKEGYSVWTNPFNGVKSYVSYEKTRFIVFWSKNPRPLLKHLHELEERHIKCYVQYSLNDYEEEKLERGVPPLDERIATFRDLVGSLGFGSVVWRFDPLVLTADIDEEKLLKKIEYIGDQLKGYTEKLVFSFADIAQYRKVKSNLEANGIPYKEWTETQMDDFARRLSELNWQKGWNYTLATCGEKIDIDKYGIQHNRCIDGDLITRLAWDDPELMRFMKVKIEQMPQASLFDTGDTPALPKGTVLLPGGRYFVSTHRKDSGQRELCGCMAAKDIGEYNTCPHLCEYCYANASKELAVRNWRQHQNNPFTDTITGK